MDPYQKFWLGELPGSIENEKDTEKIEVLIAELEYLLAIRLAEIRVRTLRFVG